MPISMQLGMDMGKEAMCKNNQGDMCWFICFLNSDTLDSFHFLDK